MDISSFVTAVVAQNEEKLRSYFAEDAVVRWPCTNECFSVAEYLRANCDYPGDWDGEIEHIEEVGDTIIIVTRVFPVDKSFSVHAVSFMKTQDDVIVELDEYWADDGEVPDWRKQLNLGKSIR
ncbi:nuclear transport factor 2 family protein [Streptococcus sp. ZJ93]|uniref:nuclear transport factor 2 family protein n=1 Tax=Streptococcus handemini TaxID=3161188 RepID=UPI0032EEBEC1